MRCNCDACTKIRRGRNIETLLVVVGLVGTALGAFLLATLAGL